MIAISHKWCHDLNILTAYRPLMKSAVFICLAICLSLPSSAFATPAAWTFEAAEADLRRESCDRAEGVQPFSPLALSVETINAGPADLPSARLAGAWVLSSDDRALGGLSGLSLTETGDLLSVSDVGQFIRIEMNDGEPSGTASRAAMRFENPLIRPSKLTADAEGLAYRDGLALVSFERHYRVLGFDLSGCGAAARGITIAKPPRHYDKQRLRANSGPEALSLHPDGTLSLGYEQPREGRAVTAHILNDGTATLSNPETDLALPVDFRQVGMDHLATESGAVISVTLLRAYDRDTGNRSILSFTSDDGPAPSQISLEPPMTVDNFEGIALQEREGGLRAYIISDDNFSNRQQTLLYALDVNWSD